MPTLATTAVHHAHPDEDYINKSLLASLDAQADAEPISSSDDSDHPVATSFGSTSTTSSGSPSVNFPAAALHHHIPRPDSPGDTTPHSFHSLHSQELYIHQPGIYAGANHVNTLHMHAEFADDYDSPKFHPQQQQQQQQQPKLNGFSNNHYRAFNSFPNTTRSRHQANQSILPSPTTYRDTAPFYPASNPDAFPMTSPVQSHMQPYDSRLSYDFTNGQPNGPHKSYLVDQYGAPNNSSLHNAGKPAAQQQQAQQALSAYPAPAQYANGVQLSSQTPYGPHVLTNVAMGAPSNPNVPSGLPSSGSLNINNSANITATGEEISTIFVVGFPEDMQEREFQNMFTFSPGFEAATLKIPNKEYTAYGGLVGATPGATLANGVNGLRGPTFQSYGGSNDPYNIVTVNQGGVVVDGGRDGTMASWPAANPLASDDLSQNQHFLSSGPLGIAGLAGVPGVGVGGAAGANLPPRKQIIGFAKFRTREEALVARDVLQGRRVDIEKGAVLKAEMAKKNLHTKRGVGPIPGVSAAGAAAASANPLQAQASTSSTSSQPQQQHMNGMSLDSFPPREHRDSTSLPGFSRLGWRDSVGQEQQQQTVTEVTTLAGLTNGNGASSREEEDRKRDSTGFAPSLGNLSLSGPPPLSPISTGPGAIMTHRGARERAEEEEKERRRKEKEMNLMRLRAKDSATFDAFHGVPSVNTAPAASSSTASSAGPAASPISRQSSNASANAAPSSAGTGGLLTPSTAPTTVPAESVAGSSPMVSPAESQPQQQSLQEVVGPWDRVNSARPAGSSSQRSNSPPGASQDGPHHKAESESSQTSGIGGSVSGNGNPLGPIGPGSSTSSGTNGEISATVRTATGELVLNNLNQMNNTHHLHHHLQQLQQPSLAGTIGTSFVGAGVGANVSAGGPGTASSGSNGNGNTSPTLPSPASGGSSGSVSTTSVGLRGTVDQNPPINTLYVGNLPTSPPPLGYPHDYLEETLREVFSVRPGYRKLCFRQKAAGPMCFVEFEDVQYAARAMAEMSGNTLRGAVKNGIRLSYSKNPLGVRTPTSAGSGNGGPTLQQQQQLMQTLSNHHYAQFNQGVGGAGDSSSFQTRVMDDFGGHPHHRVPQQPTILRRDSSAQGQPGQGYGGSGAGSSNPNNFFSLPPPRFYSTSPGTNMSFSGTTLTGASSAFVPRSAAAGGPFGGGAFAGSPPSFSPFGAFSAGESPFGQHLQQHSIPNEQQMQQHQQQQQHQLGHLDD